VARGPRLDSWSPRGGRGGASTAVPAARAGASRTETLSGVTEQKIACKSHGEKGSSVRAKKFLIFFKIHANTFFYVIQLIR
jgi:hypothetical protein